MTRDEALKALNILVKDPDLKKHHLVVAACMRSLAQYLKNKNKGSLFGIGAKQDIDPDDWEVVGLVHDADYERTKDRPVEHGAIIVDEIRSLGYKLTPEQEEAVKFHNYQNTHAKESLMGWAIVACESLSGLIIATTLSDPQRKLDSLTVERMVDKLNDANFAKDIKRDELAKSKDKLGLSTEDLLTTCLPGVQAVATSLGL